MKLLTEITVSTFPCEVNGKELLWRMPYLFPHEDLFVLGIGTLIVGLLLVRVGLARIRHRRSERSDGSDSREARVPP